MKHNKSRLSAQFIKVIIVQKMGFIKTIKTRSMAFMAIFSLSCHASAAAAAFTPRSCHSTSIKPFSISSQELAQRFYMDPIFDSDINTDDSSDRLSYGERSRLYRRTVFNAEDWIKHRSHQRFFRNLFTIFSSGIFVDLIDEVLVISLVAIFTEIWNCFAVEGWTDFHGIHHASFLHFPDYLLLSLPQTQFTWSVTALGLLLVFRTNTSYARWLDARSAWGRMVNHSRNIMRLASTWTLNEYRYASTNKYTGDGTSTDTYATLKNLALTVWALPRSLQRHLLSWEEDEETFQRDIRKHLDPTMAEDLINARHRPTRALFYLSQAVDALPLCVEEKIAVDNSIVVLTDMMGTCERIFSSPVPLVYTRHTARFLSAWLLLLPLALWEPFSHTWNHVGMIPTSMFISFFFFGIEELAVQLEEPFSILPMKALTDGILLSTDEYVHWYTIEKEKKGKQNK